MHGSGVRLSFTLTAQMAKPGRYEAFIVAYECTYGWALMFWHKSEQEGQKASKASIVDSISTVRLRLALW